MAKQASKAAITKPKRDRGTTIYYDNIPSEVYDLLLDTQCEMGKKLKRVVSQSEAITKLLKPLVPAKQING